MQNLLKSKHIFCTMNNAIHMTMLIYLKKKTKPAQYQPQFVPLLKINGNIPVQTLPSPITFAEDPAQSLPPYVPGSNKQQYLRGVQQTKPELRTQTRPAKPFQEHPQFVPLIKINAQPQHFGLWLQCQPPPRLWLPMCQAPISSSM